MNTNNNNHLQEEIEYEAKSILTQKEYNLLIDFLKLDIRDAKEQTNAFFDTKSEDLNKINVTMRVRTKSYIRELTIKEGNKGSGRPETNHKPLTNRQFAHLLGQKIVPNGPVKDKLRKISIDGPYLFYGDLITDRILIPYKGCKLALDKNKYLDIIDFEIEMERDGFGIKEEDVLIALLNECNIPYRKSKSKRARFFQRFHEVNIV